MKKIKRITSKSFRPETVCVIHTFDLYDHDGQQDSIDYSKNARLVKEMYDRVFRPIIKHGNYEQGDITLHEKTVNWLWDRVRRYLNEEE